MTDKIYKEGYFQVKNLATHLAVEPIPESRYRELVKSCMPEIQIPHEVNATLYRACYIMLDIPDPTIQEIHWLKEHTHNVIMMFPDAFKEVDHV